jgi:hypothetical protein
MQGLEGSIRAVMHALSKRGISDDSLLEIECCMGAGKHRLAVERCMLYLDRCFQYDQDLVQLMIHAWQALNQYHGLLHKRAFRECRPEEGKPFPPRYKGVRQNALAEVCISQVTLYKMVNWQKYLQARDAANKHYEERRREEDLDQALITLQQWFEEDHIDEQEREAEEQEVAEVLANEQLSFQKYMYFKEEVVDEQEQEAAEVQANDQQDV